MTPLVKVKGGTDGGRMMRQAHKTWTCTRGHTNPHWRGRCSECQYGEATNPCTGAKP